MKLSPQPALNLKEEEGEKCKGLLHILSVSFHTCVSISHFPPCNMLLPCIPPRRTRRTRKKSRKDAGDEGEVEKGTGPSMAVIEKWVHNAQRNAKRTLRNTKRSRKGVSVKESWEQYHNLDPEDLIKAFASCFKDDYEDGPTAILRAPIGPQGTYRNPGEQMAAYLEASKSLQVTAYINPFEELNRYDEDTLNTWYDTLTSNKLDDVQPQDAPEKYSVSDCCTLALAMFDHAREHMGGRGRKYNDTLAIFDPFGGESHHILSSCLITCICCFAHPIDCHSLLLFFTVYQELPLVKFKPQGRVGYAKYKPRPEELIQYPNFCAGAFLADLIDRLSRNEWMVDCSENYAHKVSGPHLLRVDARCPKGCHTDNRIWFGMTISMNSVDSIVSAMAADNHFMLPPSSATTNRESDTILRLLP